MSPPSSEQSWAFMVVVIVHGPTLLVGGQEQDPVVDNHREGILNDCFFFLKASRRNLFYGFLPINQNIQNHISFHSLLLVCDIKYKSTISFLLQ
jgi:hypothetical protein